MKLEFSRSPAKVVHWDFWMFAALLLSILSTSINLYATNSLNQGGSTFNVGKSLLIIATSLILINYALEAISNFRELATDVRLRRTLSVLEDVKPSLVNNDIKIAIGVIHFYAYAPGNVFAIFVYLAFVAVTSVPVFIAIILFVGLLLYPVRRYTLWRGNRIQQIRAERNSLLDDNKIHFNEYIKIIDRYEQVYKDFWRIDVAVGFLFILAIIFSIFQLYFMIPENQGRLGILAVYLLLIAEVRSLVLNLSVYQENKRSVDAIEINLRKGVRGQK